MKIFNNNTVTLLFTGLFAGMFCWLTLSCHAKPSTSQGTDSKDTAILSTEQDTAPAMTGDSLPQPYVFYTGNGSDDLLGIMFEGEYTWMSDEIVTRGMCHQTKDTVYLFDHKENVWAIFLRQKKEWNSFYDEKKVSMSLLQENDIPELTVAQRLLIKNPYLTWYDASLQFTVAAKQPHVLYAIDVEPIMDFIRSHYSQETFNEDIRYSFYDAWACAWMENPESLNDGFLSVKEDLMAKILFTGSPESEKAVEQAVYEKLDQLTKRYPHCFQNLYAWITGMAR